MASNLLKCSLNTEEEIRLPLIDLDLQRADKETTRGSLEDLPYQTDVLQIQKTRRLTLFKDVLWSH